MFGLNTFYLKFLLGNIKHKDDGWSHTALSLISGGLSGATTLCMFYPLLFCQTHLAAHVGPLVDREYTGLLDCIQKTVHTSGFRTLYTGKTFLLIVFYLHYPILYMNCCVVQDLLLQQMEW